MPIACRFCGLILIGMLLSQTARALAAEELLGAAVRALPPLTAELAAPEKADWLVSPISRRAGIYRTEHPDEIVLSNGLVSRTFRLALNAATTPRPSAARTARPSDIRSTATVKSSCRSRSTRTATCCFRFSSGDRRRRSL